MRWRLPRYRFGRRACPPPPKNNKGSWRIFIYDPFLNERNVLKRFSPKANTALCVRHASKAFEFHTTLKSRKNRRFISKTVCKIPIKTHKKIHKNRAIKITLTNQEKQTAKNIFFDIVNSNSVIEAHKHIVKILLENFPIFSKIISS